MGKKFVRSDKKIVAGTCGAAGVRTLFDFDENYNILKSTLKGGSKKTKSVEYVKCSKCGKSYNKVYKKRHLMSKYHQITKQTKAK